MCAFTACVRFLRRRGPAGLRSLFFGYSVVIFALPPIRSKHGNDRAAAGEHRVLRKSARNQLEILLLGRDAALPRRKSHSGSQGQTRWISVWDACWDDTPR